MNYEIIELQQFSGKETTIYSILPEGEAESLFEKFVNENKDKFKDEIKDILKRIYIIGNETGARSSFFKPYEGKRGDFVSALYDLPEKRLRLYCMRFGMVAIILGGGGEKTKETKAWQDNEKLKTEATKMINYADDILKKIDEKEIFWSKDRKELEGNLKNYDHD